MMNMKKFDAIIGYSAVKKGIRADCWCDEKLRPLQKNLASRRHMGFCSAEDSAQAKTLMATALVKASGRRLFDMVWGHSNDLL